MRRLVRRVLPAVAAFGVASLVGGCETLIGADFGVTPGSCDHHFAPPRPEPGTYGGTATYTVAVWRTNFGVANGAFRSLGLDLDGVCTNESQGPGCVAPPWPGLWDGTDGVDGIDNGIGGLIDAQYRDFKVPYLSESAINGRVDDGSFPPPLVIRITGYNGRLKDGDVGVELFLPAAVSPACKPTGQSVWGAGPRAIPLDERTAVLDGDGHPAGTMVAYEAYVNGGVLVARFRANGEQKPSFRLRNTAYAFESVVLTAAVPTSQATFTKFDFAGVLAVSEMFRQVGALTSEDGQSAECRDSPSFGDIKRYVCGFVDMRADGVAAPTQRCNAMSLGLAYDTVEASLGPIVAADVRPACPPGLDPSNEDCFVPAAPPIDAGGLEGNCVPAGTPNNDQNVGGACTQPSDCPGTICSANFGAPKGAYFCTKLCANAGDSCGAGVHCVSKPGKPSACVPDVCVVPDDAGADAPPDAPAVCDAAARD